MVHCTLDSYHLMAFAYFAAFPKLVVFYLSTILKRFNQTYMKYCKRYM